MGAGVVRAHMRAGHPVHAHIRILYHTTKPEGRSADFKTLKEASDAAVNLLLVDNKIDEVYWQHRDGSREELVFDSYYGRVYRAPHAETPYEEALRIARNDRRRVKR